MGRHPTPTVADHVLKLFDSRCALCHDPIDEDSAWEIDHAEEWGVGGPTEVRNLWPLCSQCHSRKTRLLTKLLGPSYFVPIRRAWDWWFAECTLWSELIANAAIETFAERLESPNLAYFTSKCATHRVVLDTLETHCTQSPMLFSLHGSANPKSLARVFLTMGVIADRCADVSKSAQYLIWADQAARESALPETHPFRVEHIAAWNHLALKSRGRLKCVRQSPDSVDRSNHERIIQNELQAAFWAKDLDRADELFGKHSSAMSRAYLCRAIEPYAATMLWRPTPARIEHAASLDAAAFRLSVEDIDQRTMLIRTVNLFRSAECAGNWELAAEAYKLAINLSHAAVGLDDNPYWVVIHKRFVVRNQNLATALGRINRRRGVALRFVNIRRMLPDTNVA